MSPEIKQKNEKLRQNITNVQNAKTAYDADSASHVGLGGSFLFRTSSYNLKKLNGPLTDIWERCCKVYGDPSEPWPLDELNLFKMALIARLETIIVPEIIWDDQAPLSETAKLVHQMHLRDSSQLMTIPQSLLQRCWQVAADDPKDESAAAILEDYYRTSIVRGKFEDTGELKRLVDVLSRQRAVKLSSVGIELHNKLAYQFQEGLKANAVDPSLMNENPMLAIESAFNGERASPEDHFLTGLMMAAYRGRLLGSEVYREEYLLSMVFLALREAYHFHLANRTELANSALAWALPTSTIVKDQPNPVAKDMLGQFLKSAVMHDKNTSPQRLEVLRMALPLLLPDGEDYAGCLFEIGLELEKQKNLPEAIRTYEACLASPGCQDHQLRGAVQGSLNILLAGLEGDFTKLTIEESLLQAADYDTDLVQNFRRFMTLMSNGEKITDEESLLMLNTLQRLIAKWEKEKYDRNSILTQYLVMLKLALSMDDPRKAPFNITQTMERAREHFLGADPALVTDFEILESFLENSAGSTPSPQHIQMLDLKHLFASLQREASLHKVH